MLGTILSLLFLLVLFFFGAQWYKNKYLVRSTNQDVYVGQSVDGAALGLSMRTGYSASNSKEAGNYSPTADSSAPQEIERLVIKTGEVTVVVKDVRAVIKSISEFVEQKKGFVVNSQIYKSGLAPYGIITVRIPSKEFESGILEIKSLGEVQRESVNGNDVTEEYVDLDARLRNLLATEKQFLDILKKAEKITDILAVERELSQVRSNIEVLEGRMKYLKTSAEMSSLTVHLSTDPNVLPTIEDPNEWKPLAVLKAAVRGLISVGKNLANLLIYFVVFIPLWLLIVLIVWVARLLVRRARRGEEGMNFKR